MDPANDRRRRRLLIALIAGGLALLLLVGVGIYGLLRGPATPGHDPAPDPAPSSTDSPVPPRGTGPVAVPRTGGPEAFARNVAAALFTWDTAAGYGPADYAQGLADVAAHDETDSFVGDVRSYLPSTEAWAQLRQYQTRQWLTIDEVVVPEAWATAVAQAAPGQIPEGATAYTITGTRHRDGTWGTQPVEVSRRVSFTVFIVCARPIPGRSVSPGLCEVLRLSELDNPLR